MLRGRMQILAPFRLGPIVLGSYWWVHPEEMSCCRIPDAPKVQGFIELFKNGL